MTRFSDQEIAEARDVPVIDELQSRGIALKKAGLERIGPCPVCGGTDRFGVSLQKNVWNCRNCSEGGGSIQLVMWLDDCDFPTAIRTLLGRGPDGSGNGYIGEHHSFVRPEYQEQQADDDSERIKYALSWWDAAKSVKGTLAEGYLKFERGIADFPPEVDEVLRFHPRCIFGKDENDQSVYYPCLLALFRNVLTEQPTGIHRIALTPQGRKIDRKALGIKTGSAIKLWPDAEIASALVVGEGLETVLSAALAVEHNGTLLQPAWALIDAGNLESFAVIDGVEHLVILADNDQSKRGEQAAIVCATRYSEAGADVEILLPNTVGEDFNDIAKRR
jgi:putative DNA primase/helicase